MTKTKLVTHRDRREVLEKIKGWNLEGKFDQVAALAMLIKVVESMNENLNQHRGWIAGI